MSNVPFVVLNDGNKIPCFGLGTYQGRLGHEEEVGDAVKFAIDVGYRHFDCAHVYKNEKIIGDAFAEKISEGVVKREDLFITSKLWNTFHDPKLIEVAIRQSLKDLGVDYVDLYLMHWPFGYKEGDELMPKDPKDPEHCYATNVDYIDTWKAMEELVAKGLTKSIGISNFNSSQIDRLLKTVKIVPAMNQVECHPYLNQSKLRKYCASKNIAVTAYSPLYRYSSNSKPQNIFDDVKFRQIAEAHKKSPAQILLRYQIELGNIAIPKSATKERLAENINIFDFTMRKEEVDYLNTFDCNGRIGLNEFSMNHPYYPFYADF